MKLAIGNKNYSSWSLRPWLALAQAGIPFEEEVIHLDRPDTAARIQRFSPSGRVPALVDGDLTVWDSLAICEYVSEKFPEKRLWPEDAKARAVARSVTAEMHSGFTALRTECTMNLRATLPCSPSPEVKQDVQRIVQLWEETRSRFGKGGPLLFGHFTIADAFYAPVVSRFRTYGIALSGEAKAYAGAVWALPAMQRWAEASRAEKEVVARYEPKK